MNTSQSQQQELPRVIQIGYNKCATRSLQRLFEGAGHPVLQFRINRRFRRNLKAAKLMRENLQAGRRMFHGMEDYVYYGGLVYQTDEICFEAIRHFREMLRDYPGSILILNFRDREDWIRSRLRHGRGELVQRVMRQRGVVTPEEVANLWRQEWDEHLADVRSFMQDYPDQLIELNLDTDEVQSLIDRLPAYGLNAEDWGDHGRTRGKSENSLLKSLKNWWSKTRPRP